MAQYADGLRKTGQRGPTIPVIDWEDLTDDIQATEFDVEYSEIDNVYRVLVLNSQGEYYSVRTSKNVVVTETEPIDIIKELVTKYIIYSEIAVDKEGNKYRWFSFGVASRFKSIGKRVTMKDLKRENVPFGVA
jgi:hypothetical protein